MAAKKNTTTSEKVMSMVEKELAENPDASVDELYDKAKKVDASVTELTKRQFHARYPLQIKRRKSRSKPARKRKKKEKKTSARSKGGRAKKGAGKAPAARASAAGSADAREAVREVFLSFASTLAAAEARKDVVKVLAGVDRYVADAIEAAKTS